MKSRKGNWIARWKTDGKRLSQALKAIGQWCWADRHIPRKEQYEKLAQKMRGYYGISLNYRWLAQYYQQVNLVEMAEPALPAENLKLGTIREIYLLDAFFWALRYEMGRYLHEDWSDFLLVIAGEAPDDS
jgi:hypothetical protein